MPSSRLRTKSSTPGRRASCNCRTSSALAAVCSFFLAMMVVRLISAGFTDLTTSYTSRMSLRVRASSGRAIEMAVKDAMNASMSVFFFSSSSRNAALSFPRMGILISPSAKYSGRTVTVDLNCGRLVRVMSSRTNIGCSPCGFVFFESDNVAFAITDY